jgi:hypothetical protein
VGRPSTFTQKAADEICERLSKGEPLAVICRDGHMPGYRTVYDWKDADPAFAANIACARDDGYDAIAIGTRETARGIGDSTGDVQRDKLIIDTDLKLLAKWDPRRYGDRVALTGADGGAVKIERIERHVVDPK